MLILARKIGENIIIGDDILIKLLDIKNGIAKIGIEAPRSITVYREEIVRQIELENQQAALNSNIDFDDGFLSEEEDVDD